MAFVYEKITEEDIEKYNLLNINIKLNQGLDSNRHLYDWVIDRENISHLRAIGNDWQEPSDQNYCFIWKNNLVRVNFNEKLTGDFDKKIYDTTFALRDESLWLPDVIELDELNTLVLVSHDIENSLAISDTAFILANQGNKAGATITDTIDLIEMDLCWNKDIKKSKKFQDLVADIKLRM